MRNRVIGWAAALLGTAVLLSPPVIAREREPSGAAGRQARVVKTDKSSKPTAAAAQAARAPVRARVPRVSSPPRMVRTLARPAAPVPPRALAAAPGRMSIGQSIGLHATDDPLDLRSSVALVVDQQTGQELFAKNPQAVLPIASITKLMTAMVVLDARQPLTETLEISEADIDTEKGSRSRLRPGTRLTRGELLQLALMSSENRAANALGRYYPGGLTVFVSAMNAKARAVGMRDTTYVEPTGLSSANVSNARDLAVLVRAAFEYPLVRQFSTASELTVESGNRPIHYHNTNRLIASPSWDIAVQKTGYIAEAGSCLVMQASIDGRPLVFVLLDANGAQSRFGDAQRIRQWLASRATRPFSARNEVAQRSLGS